MISRAYFTLSCCMLFYFLEYHRVSSNTISYTSSGHWDNSTEFDCNHYLCTDHKYTWNATSDPNYQVYNKDLACAKMIEKGIKMIYFHGDSYMRHIYAAMLIFFKDNYQSGSLLNPEENKQCHYHRQFFEKRCNIQLLDQNGTICDGKVYLDPNLRGVDNLNHCESQPGSVLLWSGGNHKLSRGRYGVNNATAYQLHFEKSICPSYKTAKPPIDGHVNGTCSTWWISTHARRIGWFGDEYPEVVKEYNVGMREFFDSKRCGNINYIDVYNMTNTLLQEQPGEAEKLTFDNVHWGMEVNLMKVQIILNGLFQLTNR